MTEQAALRAAIIADPDDDTARLVYADWLDENRPDHKPSPAVGDSARAEFIRVQCRLAANAFSDPNYPDLLEREADLATWLNTHDSDNDPDWDDRSAACEFAGGEWGGYRRGFRESVGFAEFDENPVETVDRIVQALESSFAQCPGRTLILQDALAEEIVRLVRHPVFGQLRGLYLDGLDEGSEDDAVAAIARSPNSRGLRRLHFDFPIGRAGIQALFRSPNLGTVESLVLNDPDLDVNTVQVLGRTKWFRNLQRLHLWVGRNDSLSLLASLPTMPRLVSLTVRGTADGNASGLRKFASSRAFPRLAHLDLGDTCLSAEHIEVLARGRWPLRHLRLAQNEIRKSGTEALAEAAFAPTLKVLDLRACAISAGGVQVLAETTALMGLRHLDLAENPIGPGGLETLAASAHFRSLRSLDLGWTNSARGPIAASDMAAFLADLQMPRLKHLKLTHLPVGVRGAKTIAANPDFACLTQLDLAACSLGEAGTKAIVNSKTLENLVVLNLSANKVGGGCGKLASRTVFPLLACCYLGTGVPRRTATRLRRRPGVRV